MTRGVAATCSCERRNHRAWEPPGPSSSAAAGGGGGGGGDSVLPAPKFGPCVMSSTDELMKFSNADFPPGPVGVVGPGPGRARPALRPRMVDDDAAGGSGGVATGARVRTTCHSDHVRTTFSREDRLPF